MHEIMELKEMLCDELEKYGSKGDLSAGELEIVDKLAHSVKNLAKIIEMADDEEYSGAYDGDMSYRSSYRGGGSYRGGQGGSYARGRGSRARRDSRGRYSREGGYSRAAEDIAEQLRDLMAEAPDAQTKKEIQRLVTKMEQM